MHVRFRISCIMLVFLVFPAYAARENSTELYRQGENLARQGKYADAADVFRKVIAISPWYALGHYGLGKTSLYLPGEMDNAIKELRTAVELDSELARAYFYLGMAYYFSEKYMPAVHAFSEAYRLDPTMIEVLYNLGVLYDLMDKSYHSGKWFNRYIEARSRVGSKRPF